jgi:preprotein translocase subunit SecG
MEKLVLIVHILMALAIIGLILLQQGKGATAGASFGAGASQTVFGSEGSGSFFTRITAIFATIFFCTSFGLALIAKNNSKVVDGIPEVIDVRSAPVSDIPVIEETTTNGADIPSVTEEQ